MDAVSRATAGILTAALLCGAARAADDLERGLDLARRGQWAEARSVLETGERQSPADKRFPLELAGLEYQRKHFAAAIRDLHRALALDPADSYGNDFLATIYFLEGNLEAALKYWNRIGKPRVTGITVSPQPRLRRVLLDRALDFSPASVLTLEQYRNTRAWLDSLDVLGPYRLGLEAGPDERFDAALGWFEPSPWWKAASMLRGVAYQTVQPEWSDIGGTGWNWTNLLRWDAQKRRVSTAFQGPLRRDPRWRLLAYADARWETWNSGAPDDFRMQRNVAGLRLQALPGSRFSWHTGLEISSRHFAGAPALAGGTALQYSAGANYALLRIPERRLRIDSSTNWDLGRMFSRSRDLYARGQASLAAHWFPQAQGSDYEMTAQLRGGSVFGAAPFDELFQLGIERDNDLWLRGHPGAIDGKKGSAPIGRGYLLSNWDLYKDVYRHPLFTIQLGPFLDTGRIHDVFGRFGDGRLLVDTGAQCRARLPGGLSVVVTYGRDLRGGGKVLYATVGR
ncbi:MAG TPA: tetratricopeptide repeat protein [Bryobacteraceae bacterium]|nr:tetratricopeptide repeat protein [Bryobacteraceae bacterium]